MSRSCYLLLLCLGYTLCPISHCRNDDVTVHDIRDDIDTFMNAIMQCNGVPGISLAVVKDSQVFMTKGYGVENLDTSKPFTDKTMVNFASLTKAFVATTMAKVFENNPGYDWTDSARSILGNTFYLSDGYMSDKASIVDLLSHRVGVARHDLTRISGWTLDELISHLRHLESSREFRHSHQYNNLMYSVADKIIQTITGQPSWENVVQQHILDPLGMNYTTFVQKQERWEDFATAYESDNGQLREMSLLVNKGDYDISSAPGGGCANAVDMAKYMNFHLSGGEAPDGTQLVDAGLLQDTHEDYGVTGSNGDYQYPNDPVTYNRENKAVGWYEGFYRDIFVTGHSGSKAGFLSLLSLFSDVNLGIFTTLTGPSVQERDYIHMYIADLMLNRTAWLDPATVCDIVDPFFVQENTGQKTEEIRDVHGLRPLEDYVGVFGNYGYGNITTMMNTTSGQLDMEYGVNSNVRWFLTQQSDTSFQAEGYGVYWYMNYDLDFTENGGSYDEVEINFDSRAPATFIRNLDMATAPPPPEIC